MGVKFTGNALSPVACKITHESHAIIQTMAPKDNGGDGSLFSPTDMLVAAYGTCVTTTMGLYAQRNHLPISQINFSLEKIMTSQLPRKVAAIKGAFHITMANPVEAKLTHGIIHAGQNCPVALSLSDSIAIECEFIVDFE